MNLKSAIAGFLTEEPRRSGRLEAIRFIRRYATRTRPFTHYRLQGPAVDAVPLLLRKAGLEDGTDFRVDRSAASDRTAKLWWLDGSGVADFMAACAVETDAREDGLSPLDHAYAFVLRGASDDSIAGMFTDASVGAGTSGAAARPAPASTAGLVLEQSRAIRRAIVSCVESGLHTEAGGNAGAFGGAISELASGENESGAFLPSLAELEFYVRIIRGKSHEHGPRDLVFSPYSTMHTVARTFAVGDAVPVGNLLDAPLYELLAGTDNPMNGYFSNCGNDLKSSSDGRPFVLAVGNAPIACGHPLATNVVGAAEFAAVRTRDFWDYVRWLYEESFVGFCAELTKFHSVGYHNGSVGISAGTSTGVLSRVDRADPVYMTAVAMYAIVISPRIRRNQFHRPLYASPDVSVVRGTPERPDLSAVAVTDAELAAEWFAITHVGGTKLPEGEDWYRYRCDDSTRQAQLDGFRRWTEELRSDPTLVGRLCSVQGNPYLHPDVTPDSAEFSPMSSLVSGVIAAFKSWNGENERVPLRDWRGADPSGCHTKGSLVTAVYSGMWSVGKSRSAIGVFSAGEGFPAVSGATLHDVITNGFRIGTQASMTMFVERLSTRETLEQIAEPPADGVRICSLVLETNVEADAFVRMAREDPDGASEFLRKVEYLFVSSLLFRNDDPFCVLNGDAVPHPGGLLEKVTGELRNRNVNATYLDPGVGLNIESIAGRYVSVTFREDSEGRLHVLFSLSGCGERMARYLYRLHCGMPLAGSPELEEAFRANSERNVVYVSDERSVETAREIIRKSCAVQPVEGLTHTENCLRPGVARPLVCRSMENVCPGDAPCREWFLSRDAGEYVPSLDVGAY